MGEYKHKRRIRKIKKFGKKLSIAIIFLVVSYLLSLFSFFLYTQLSEILLPENKGFLGFAIIGLIAGFVAVLISFVNNRFILTVVISFIIYCLIDSFLLFSKLGIQVIQFLPGLLVSMSTVIASGHFLKRKLGLLKKKNKTLDDTKEHIYKEYALARKLIENPNKLTLETFKEACGLLQGIDPKIDAVLKKADYVSRTLTFLNGGDVIGFVVSNIKVKTEEDEEKKEKLLFFIDLVHDIWEEVDVAFVKLDAAKAGENIGHQNTMVITAASGPSGIASISMAIVVATTVVATNAAGIIPMPKTQNSQEKNNLAALPSPSEDVPTDTPTVMPTDVPKPTPTLTFSTIEKTIFVSALEEGITFNAAFTDTYRFTITGGASEVCPAKSQPDHPELWGWNTGVLIYKNHPIAWGASPSQWGPPPVSWDYLIGNPNLKSTFAEAEQIGKGEFIDIFLHKDEYVIFLVNDSKGDFVDNSGGVSIQVQSAKI